MAISMSVDGFITGLDDGMDHGLGVGGEQLHDWLRHGGAPALALATPMWRTLNEMSPTRPGALRRPGEVEVPAQHVMHLRYRVRRS